MAETIATAKPEAADLALLAGMLILENGGETYRAEETVVKLCGAAGCPDSDVIALPTGLFLTLRAEGETARTYVKRVKKRTVDLGKLERVNTCARAFERGEMSSAEAKAKLDAINVSTPLNRPLWGAVAGVSTAFFTLLYGGSLFDAAIAALCGFTVQYISSSFKRTDVYRFAVSLIGSVIISTVALAACALFRTGNADLIIIGGIFPLLPGLSLITAIRDTITGDLVSGVSRLAEVMLTAAALAGGVGAVFAVYLLIGGAL